MATAVMPSCTVRLKRPHAAQLRFLRSTAQRRALRCGRRSGKTTGLGILAVEKFLQGERVLYFSPTSEQILRFWAEVTLALSEPIQQHIYRKNETLHLIELPGTDQCIRAKTAWEPDHLRGDWGQTLLLDEYQLFSERCWGEVIAPMTLDRDAMVTFAFTPPSFRTALRSNASDPRHAAKLYATAEADTTGRWDAIHFSSHENPHLSRQALADITSDMTSLAYRQEIMAENIDQIPGALWTHELLEKTRITPAQLPGLARVAVALDPAVTSGETADEMGIVAGGRGADGQGYTLRDASFRGTPAACARVAIALYDELGADVMVGEVNNGGEWIGTVIALVAAEMCRQGERRSATVNYKMVHASRGKQTRAEPVAALFEHDRAHLVGQWPLLEAQLTSWVPGMKSPDRLDALVWLHTELILGHHAAPRVLELSF